MLDKLEISEHFKQLQNNICNALETADTKGKFKEDVWTRMEGGGGKSRIIQNGAVIEKGGVNFSAVHGILPEYISRNILQQETKNENSQTFFATGISIVIHPVSPFVPIIHLNLRYFEIQNPKSEIQKFFGGGIDLTPHYINEKDAKYFHQEIKTVCDKHSPNYYSEFKKWADEYFFIKHRNEMRGIGGIFFDKLSETPEFTIENRFDFVKSVGELFAPLYVSLMNKNKNIPYTEHHKNWQLLRRGRYAEFNLVYDKGTKFGLETNGRAESILMSLPPFATWVYDYKTIANSEEDKTQKFLIKDIDWINFVSK